MYKYVSMVLIILIKNMFIKYDGFLNDSNENGKTSNFLRRRSKIKCSLITVRVFNFCKFTCTSKVVAKNVKNCVVSGGFKVTSWTQGISTRTESLFLREVRFPSQIYRSGWSSKRGR